MLLKRFNYSVQEQFKRKTDTDWVLGFIVRFRGESDFVLKFYKKFVKCPKLKESEWQEESKDSSTLIDTNQKKSINECMRDFVMNYLQTAQLVYDLVPLVSSISKDPYLN